jgi:glutamine amidotransferase
LYSPAHSLIDQSLKSTLGAETTNGDGFGVGWYGDDAVPAVYRSTEPAWNDRNLHELSCATRSRLVFAHVRASTGTPVQQTNCHPFRYGRWLWMHNGVVRDFGRVKRDLVLEIDPSLYGFVEGSTDSETVFFLALTYGLLDDPPAAVARAIGYVEDVGRRRGVSHPFQGTIATTDGESTWGFRYSSEGRSRSLYFSTAIESLRKLYPGNEMFRDADDEARLVVSEPLGSLEGAWNEVPESSYGIVRPGADVLLPFAPASPRRAIAVAPS